MKTKLVSLLAMFLVAFSGMAQGDEKYGETEEQRLKCMEALSVYRTYRDQKQYDEAYMHWQDACKECPPTVTERLYTDGVRFLKHRIKSAEEGSDKYNALVDSIILIHDLRIEHFGDGDDGTRGCDVMGIKATDLVRYRQDDYPIAYEWYKEAVNCMRENARATYIKNYYQLMFNIYATSADGPEKEELKEKMMLEYLTLQKYCDAGISKAEDDKEKEGFESAKENLDKYFIKIADDCNVLVETLKAFVEHDEADLERKKAALRLLTVRECIDSYFYEEILEAILVQEPSADGYYSAGLVKAKKDDFNGALKSFEKAAELCGNCPDAENYLLRAGQTANVVGQSSKAKSYANKVLAINPNNGNAIILIGDVIAGSQGSCAEDKMEGRSVFWLAVDYYQRAKSRDSSVAEKAQKKIITYSKQFPTVEQCFYNTLSEGASFVVPCWGESTTVRQRG